MLVRGKQSQLQRVLLSFSFYGPVICTQFTLFMEIGVCSVVFACLIQRENWSGVGGV
jgi:hypothetical protein